MAADGALPGTMCIGCGFVAATVQAHCAHTSLCPAPKVRPVACRGCLADNWKRHTCRLCEMELPA